MLPGTTVTSGFRYEPSTTDFSQAATEIAAQINDLISQNTNPSTIAVYLAAFDEVVDIFSAAHSLGPAFDNEVLRERWRRAFCGVNR